LLFNEIALFPNERSSVIVTDNKMKCKRNRAADDRFPVEAAGRRGREIFATIMKNAVMISMQNGQRMGE